ncbi:hypothetical protein MRX96_015573 [Rhipicephalus microplus]
MLQASNHDEERQRSRRVQNMAGPNFARRNMARNKNLPVAHPGPAPETSERGDRRYINPDIWSDYRILGEAVVGAPEPRPQPEGIEFRKARQLPWSSRLVTLDRLPLYGHWGVVVGGIRPYVAAAVP